MAYTLFMSGILVGRSELEQTDASRDRARGVFRPGLGYGLVQPIFSLRDSTEPAARSRYERARAALKLELTGPGGTPIATREIHILAGNERGDTALELEVVTTDPAFWSAHAG